MSLFKYLAAEIFPILGGFFIGMSLPFGHPLLSSNLMIDFVIFFPIGVILMGISYYYKFINKN